MRSFIEGVRRRATVVYVGSIKEVRLLERTKFDIKARALVDVLSVVRSPGTNPREATIEYSSYDDKTPMLAGGPQYQLQPGVKVVAFANSFASNNRNNEMHNDRPPNAHSNGSFNQNSANHPNAATQNSSQHGPQNSPNGQHPPVNNMKGNHPNKVNGNANHPSNSRPPQQNHQPPPKENENNGHPGGHSGH